MTTAIETSTFHVPRYDVPAIRDKFDRLNRRGAKLGLAGFTMEVVTDDVEPLFRMIAGRNHRVEAALVIIGGESPTLDGWRLAGVVTPMDNGEVIIKGVPGDDDLPADRMAGWRENPTHCDHCNTRRRRNDTVIMRHEDGRLVQVGRNCIQDYIGVDPKAALFYATHILGPGMPEWMIDSGARRKNPEYPMDAFLRAVCAWVRVHGWLSRGKARDHGGRPTADLALETMWSPTWDRDLLPFNMTADEFWVAADNDTDEVAMAMEWARSLPVPAHSDYLTNLGIACRQDGVTAKTAGMVASVITAYRRAMERESQNAERARRDRESEHVGSIGDRLDFSATVESLRGFDGDYGARTMVKMRTADGNVLVWWTGAQPEWIARGATVEFRGTIKNHDEFRGTKQTVVTRCSPS